MSDLETMNGTSAAKEQAAESESFDADDLRACIECGKTIVFSQNIFAHPGRP